MSIAYGNIGYTPIDFSNAIVLTERPSQRVNADLFFFTRIEEVVGHAEYYLVGARADVVDNLPLPLLYYVASSQEHPEFRPFMLYNDANKEIFFCTESTDQDIYMHCYTIDVSRPPPSTVKKVAGPFLPPRPRLDSNEQEFGVRNVQVLKTFEDEIHILATAGSMRTVVLYRIPGFENLANPDAWDPTVLVYEQSHNRMNECTAVNQFTRRPFKPETRASIVGYDSELGYLVLTYKLCYSGLSLLSWLFKMFYYDPIANAAYDLDGRTRISLPIDISADRGDAIQIPRPIQDWLIGAQMFDFNVVRSSSPRGQGRIYVPLSSVLYRYVRERNTTEYSYARVIVEVDERTKQGSVVFFDYMGQAFSLPLIHVHGRVGDTKALVTLTGGYRNVLREFDINSKTMGPQITESILGGVPRILLGTKKFNLPVEGLYISSGTLVIADRIWDHARKTVTDLSILPTGNYSVKVRASFWEIPQRIRIEVIDDKGNVEQSKDMFVTDRNIEDSINIGTPGRKRFRLRVVS